MYTLSLSLVQLLLSHKRSNNESKKNYKSITFPYKLHSILLDYIYCFATSSCLFFPFATPLFSSAPHSLFARLSFVGENKVVC